MRPAIRFALLLALVLTLPGCGKVAGPKGSGTKSPQAGQIILEPDGLKVASFGAAPDDVVTKVSQALGRHPDEDSGFVESFSVFGTCPGKMVRGVRWGGLTALFTDGATDFAPEGKRHFFYYSDANFDTRGKQVPPLGLKTSKGIGVGSTVASLKAAYGRGAEVYSDEMSGGASFRVKVAPPGSLGGALTGMKDSDTVTAVGGGLGCGE
jgi:hypothetical protein